MAGIWNNAPNWSVTLLVLTYVYMCWGCSPSYRIPQTEEKLFYSDIFAYGKVLDIIPGGYMYDSMYTVKFEVYCTFKGDPLKQFIDITRAGHEPGLCFSNQFEIGGEYFVFLRDDLTPAYNEEGNITDEILQDIPLYCDVVINQPKDLKGTPKVECPEPYPDYDGCIRHTTTVEPEPSVVVKTMAPIDKEDKLPADGTPKGGPVVGENSGGQTLVSLMVTLLCLVLAVA